LVNDGAVSWDHSSRQKHACDGVGPAKATVQNPADQLAVVGGWQEAAAAHV
jgi:hypothetical protein